MKGGMCCAEECGVDTVGFGKPQQDVKQEDNLVFLHFTAINLVGGQLKGETWSRAGEEAAALIHIMADAEGLH